MRNIIRKILQKLFHIPKPRSLPLEGFDDEPGEMTWEKWKVIAKEEFPVKYFFSETLPHLLAVHVFMPIEEFWYWIVSHTIRQYHWLDLRQPKQNKLGTIDNYRWGWIDEDRQMLFACFNILMTHMKTRNDSSYHYHISVEDIEDLKKRIEETSVEDGKQVLEAQLEFLKEAFELVNYWIVDRKADDLRRVELLHDWHEHRMEDKRSGNTERWDKMRAADEAFAQAEEQALIKLMKIRTRLWT
jgi:hypothetical protein